jgi:hypothetical protein
MQSSVMTVAPSPRVQRYAFAALLAWTGACCAGDLSTDADRGRRLFDGREVTVARLPGHVDPLPQGLGACVNCHGNAKPSNLEARLAPALDRAMLLGWLPRRGGPMSAYNQDSFCRALRTGIDPAYIILARPMPRFEIDQAQCAALWTYLTESEESRYEKH